MQRVDLLAMPLSELEAYFMQLGEKPFRARQVFDAMHRQGVLDIASMTELSKTLRERLEQEALIPAVQIEQVFVSSDGTRKYRLKTTDGHFIESVLIPNASAPGRNAICISSQVGCAMGCTFCATAALKLTRHLRPSEIISQIYVVHKDLKDSGWKNPHPFVGDSSESARLIHNIVYMGMGEPLHNYENVRHSIELLTHERGMAYAPKRITVSTSGVVKNIERLGLDTKVHIAISLNATTDPVRDIVMPVNKRWNIEALLEACRNYPIGIRRRMMFEYVMLAGINDSDEDAYRLIELMKGFRCKVNLIPFNTHPLSPYQRPSQERVLAFQKILLDANLTVFIRGTRGDDIDAACGMLGAHKLEGARQLIVQ